MHTKQYYIKNKKKQKETKRNKKETKHHLVFSPSSPKHFFIKSTRSIY